MNERQHTSGDSTVKIPWQVQVLLWWMFVGGLVVLASEIVQHG